MIKKEFIKSSVIYTVSSSLSTVASFVLLPFYTSTKLLSISDLGALSLYIGLSLLVQVVASLSIDLYVGIVYHDLKNDPDELKRKIASLNGYLLLAGAVITAAFIFAGSFFIHKFINNPPPEAFRYVIMSVLTGIFNAYFRFYSNLLIHQEKPARFFWINFLNFVTTILFSIVILKWFPLRLEGPLWGRLLSCLCIFLVSFVEITFNYGIALKKAYLKSWWQFSYPLIITAVFQWVLLYSDRYIIKPLLHNKEVAIFDIAVRSTLLISFISDGVLSALAPKIFSMMKEDYKGYAAEINKYYSAFNVFMLFMIPAYMLLIPLVLPFFISTDQYYTAFLYSGIIAAGFITRSIQNLFLYPLYFFKKTTRFIPINGISALAQVVLGFCMVKTFQLYGAAYALNFVKIIQIALYFWFCRDLVHETLNVKKIIVLPMVSLFVLWLPELMIHQYGLFMHLVHLSELCVVAILTYIVYRHEIREFLNWGLKKLRIAF